MIKWYEGCSEEVKMIVGIPLVIGLSVFAIGLAVMAIYALTKFLGLE